MWKEWNVVEVQASLALKIPETTHVYPNDDLDVHFLDEFCHCGPRKDERPGAEPMIIHNSFDRREKFEHLRDC